MGSSRKNKPVATNEPVILGGTSDLSQSPFALKKAERARAFIAKNGLPKDLGSKKKK
jgi:hypothetical protein